MKTIKIISITRLSQILSELARRRVVRTTGAYIVGIWLLAQGVADLFPAFGLPDWSVRAFVLVGLLGVPFVILLSWRYNITAQGIVRDTGGLKAPTQNEALPNDVAQWARDRHDLTETGYLFASWSDAEGAAQRRQFFEPIVIGRDVYNDIQLSDLRVSRRHTVLWAENGMWRVRDLNSSNGTFVNGNRVEGATVLPSHCLLQFDNGGPVVELTIDTTEPTLRSADGVTVA